MKTKIYKFKDLGKIITGKTPPTSKLELYGNEYQFITPSDIPTFTERYILSTERGLSKLGYNKMKSIVLPYNSIGVVCIGSTIGKICLTTSECITNQQLNSIIVNKERFDPLYLYYSIRSYIPKIQAITGGTGAGKSILNKTSFEELEIELYEEFGIQQKIAKFLSNYDDLIENNNRRIKILEEMAQKIYKEWFVDFKFPGHETTTFKDSPLGKIPNDWEVDFVKNILIRLKSKHKYTQNNILKEGKIIVIDQSTSEYLGFHNDKPDFKANPQKPLIIFGDHTCKMQMLVEDFSIGPNVIPISSEKVPITFLYYLIDSLIETKEYKRHWNDLISKKVVLPINSLSESFSNIITPLMTMINHLKHKNMKLKQTRDILLPRLISGEINVENMEIQ